MDITRHEDSMLLTSDGLDAIVETVLVERPVEVALNDESVGSSMVLFRDLEEFAAGFLFGRGLVREPSEIVEVIACPEGRISVYASIPEDRDPGELIVTSGCGGTGKIAKSLLEEPFAPLDECEVSLAEVGELIRGTLSHSDLSNETHCVHACGFWSEGRLAGVFEDVGRHNAVDKVIGAILLRRFPPRGAIYTTGRLTSDMVLKCARIGIPVVLSRTAPSSLGIDIARRAGLTLAGYARPGRLNVFAGPQRFRL